MNDSIRDIETAFEADYDGELPASVDRAALRRMEFVSRLLDDVVRIPGTNFRVGLDPVLGALPISGDIASAGISLYIVLEAANLGVSYEKLLRMLGNIALDVAVGSIPVIGTLFDAVWKANRRNLELALSDLAEATDADVADEREEPITVEIE